MIERIQIVTSSAQPLKISRVYANLTEEYDYSNEDLQISDPSDEVDLGLHRDRSALPHHPALPPPQELGTIERSERSVHVHH